jgi:hypothetical protein
MAAGTGGGDLLGHLDGIDDLLAGEVAAPLVGAALVLELDGSRPGGLQQPDGHLDLTGAAEAGVGVDDDGDRHGAGQDSRLLDELIPREQADVGYPERSG